MALVSLQGYWLRQSARIAKCCNTRARADGSHVSGHHLSTRSQYRSEYLQQLLKNEISTYSMEKRYFRADGSIVWVQLTVALNRLAERQAGPFLSRLSSTSASARRRKPTCSPAHELEERVETARMSSTWWLKLNEEIETGTRRISAQRGERTPARHYRQHAGVNQPDRRQ